MWARSRAIFAHVSVHCSIVRIVNVRVYKLRGDGIGAIKQNEPFC